ncbi:MAG: chalcone isomerase family protein, partial [Myxococcales bacterium]|nr:chalcone isomerase family protein [Myxococcales bacterium]
MRILVPLLACLALLTAPPAFAAKKEGVSMPDTVEVAGQKLVLNGLGVREATVFNVNVYVAGLYLPQKVSSSMVILATDQPWRIVLSFVRDVEKDKLVDAWKEGFGHQKGDHTAGLATLNKAMVDMKEKDTMVFTYVPGTGTTVEVKGANKGTIAGADFAKALLGIWLGSHPPNEGLKKGML